MGKWNPIYESNRKYNKRWEKIYPWLQQNEGGTPKQSAYCKICQCNMQAKRNTISAHEKSRKHQRNLPSISSTPEKILLDKTEEPLPPTDKTSPPPCPSQTRLIRVIKMKTNIDGKVKEIMQAQLNQTSGSSDSERLHYVNSPASPDSSDDECTSSIGTSRFPCEKNMETALLNPQNETTVIGTQKKILETLAEIDRKLTQQISLDIDRNKQLERTNQLLNLQTRILAKMANIDFDSDETNA